PQSETVWRQADKYSVPRICFVNKMDRTGANFYRTVDMIISRLNATPLVMQLPWGTEGDFTGVIDLVQMKGLLWANDEKTAKGDVFDVVEIPAEYAEQAEEWRAEPTQAPVDRRDPRAGVRRDVLGARLQDPDRPARRPPHLHPGLLRDADLQPGRRELHEGPQGEDRPPDPDARQLA